MMRKVIQLEEIALFAASVYAFSQLGLSWWWFAGCLLLPDISILAYLHNPRTGAFIYNLFHHRGIALMIAAWGYFMHNPWVLLVGVILFIHATMDRMLGYGLKLERGFKFTHLGEIGEVKGMQ